MKYKKLINLLMIPLFIGCAYTNDLKIQNQIEKIGRNCVDKAIIYHKYQLSKGIESRVVSGHHVKYPKGINHAWTQYLENGKWLNTYPVDESEICERKESCKGTSIDFIYKKDITFDEVKEEKGIIWRR